MSPVLQYQGRGVEIARVWRGYFNLSQEHTGLMFAVPVAWVAGFKERKAE